MEEQGKQGKQGNNKADAEAGARASLGEEGQSRFAKPGPDFDGLQARLLEAANGALANPAVAPGLLTLAEPLNWIDAGADLDRDILPAIVEVSGKHKLRARAKPISSWGYFANRVAELKAAREAGLPTIVLDQTGPTGIRGKSKFEMLRDVVAKHNAKFEGSRS
jgi:hypothetical protein